MLVIRFQRGLQKYTNRRGSGNGQRGVAVNGSHLGRLLRKVGAGPLDDAQPVDPDVLDGQEAGDDHNVLKQRRQVVVCNARLARLEVGRVGQEGRGRDGAPAVAQR